MVGIIIAFPFKFKGNVLFDGDLLLSAVVAGAPLPEQISTAICNIVV